MLRTLRLLVLVSASLSFMLNQSARAQASFSDSFHSTSLDSTLWSTDVQAVGSIDPQADGLHITLAAGNSGPSFYMSVNSRCTVQGDFDAQVDYRLVGWPQANGSRLGLWAISLWQPASPPFQPANAGTQRTSQTDGREVYASAMPNGAYTEMATADGSGRLRMTRTADTSASYFDSSNGWVLLDSRSDPQIVRGASFGLQLTGYSSTPGVEIVLENFSVTAEGVRCPLQPGGPFTPEFSFTFDDAAPANVDVLPVSDDCRVGAPCKYRWQEVVPDMQPNSQGTGIVVPSALANFGSGGVVPDGAIIGKLFGTTRAGWPGTCVLWGGIHDWWVDFLDATIDPATTTGSQSDLCSFSNWPSQLNAERDSLLAANPGAVLNRRLMGCSPTLSVNTLIVAYPNGASAISTVLGGPELPVFYETCAPSVTNFVALGVSADNPSTSLVNEGGILLQVCNAPGTYTVPDSFDRVDTPPGDPVVVTDTTSCSPNTPTGSSVAVPLNGGTTLRGGIDVTFAAVSSLGSTSVVTRTTGPAPPTGYNVVGLSELPLYFDINTDATYSGSLSVCVMYDETQVTGPEANLKLLHDEGAGFVDITTSVDTTNNIVCGSTTHLSTFVVAELVATATATPVPSPTPRPTVTPTRSAGVGGKVQLPPQAITSELDASSDDSAWQWATGAALGSGALLLAALAGYARRWRAR